MNTQHTLILEGTAQAQQSKTYLMLPFEIPENVIQIDVAYEYTNQIGSDPHLTDGNTVDIGIFDTRGYEFMGKGFRGWSGSARQEFTIGITEATPGYMAGSLQAGTWAICLGAYKIADSGCQYQVAITFTFSDKVTLSPFPPRLSLNDIRHSRNEHGWYKGELHCHSYHSDGDSDPLEVIERAEALGLDFLAITDHNVLSHQVTLHDAETNLMLIPGMEVTTYQGHWNIWGDGDWIDFRVHTEADMQHAVDSALEQGYMVSCNHPKPYGPEWVYSDITNFHCIEVWNGPWANFNEVALAYWKAQLAKGKKTVAVGGSDCHFHRREHPAKLAQPTTFIHCQDSPSPAQLLKALQQGHAFISESVQGAEIYLSIGDSMMGDTITNPDDTLILSVHIVNADGKQLEIWGASLIKSCPIESEDMEVEIELTKPYEAFVRAEVISHTGEQRHVHALSNPIYIQ